MRFSKSVFVSYLSWLFLSTTIASSPSQGSEPLVIYAGEWPPYVSREYDTDLEELVSNLLQLDHDQVKWDYTGFYFALEHLRSERYGVAFPYFNTAERNTEFLLSAPVLTVNNVLIYNERHRDLASAPSDMDDKFWQSIRLGGVVGYSYINLFGSRPLPLQSFATEAQAVEALLAGTIDALPIERNVWRSIALQHFPNRFFQLREVPEIEWDETLHVLAPDTPSGQRIIDTFNRRLAAYHEHNQDVTFQYDLLRIVELHDKGVVWLTSNGVRPVVYADYINDSEEAERLVLPNYTKGLVLEWAPDYFSQASAQQSALNVMQSRSLLLLLNGPHVGKRVWVENIHIQLEH